VLRDAAQGSLPSTTQEHTVKRAIPFVVAAVFSIGSVSAFAAKHMSGEKDAKKPTAEECAKDPKMAGCEKAKK
jgi:hypothetical protein